MNGRPLVRPVAGRAEVGTIWIVENHEQDEAYLDNLSQPVELTHLETMASGAMMLNHEWVAYLDAADLPSHVVGVDDHIHHGAQEGGTAYA